MNILATVKGGILSAEKALDKLGPDARAVQTELLDVAESVEPYLHPLKAKPIAKTYESNIGDLAATSADFKTLADQNEALVASYDSEIEALGVKRDAAATIATKATAAAASIDAMLAAMNPAPAPVATAAVTPPVAPPTA